MAVLRVVLFVAAVFFCSVQSETNRSFVIDYPNNQFLKDGKPFRFISGSIHYFRVPQEYWRDRLRKIRAAGLDTIYTIIEWSSHEPEPGQYDFSGNLNITEFLGIAQEEDLLVVLRCGPYIDAERDMGGLPYWLLRERPDIKIRTSDPDFEYFVEEWYKVVLPMLKPYIYAEGGPVIMAQVENEYGSYGCDWMYKNFLRDTMREYLGDDIVLFTTDGPEDSMLQCGRVPLVFPTIDFGTETSANAEFDVLRDHQPYGPLVNSEFYPGWIDHWEYPHSHVSAEIVAYYLDKLLALNASVNIYIFHGGTSFGFKAGANYDSSYMPCPTSYDFDAPLTEAGDPTEKYYQIRNVVGKYVTLPNMSIPQPSPKGNYGDIQMSLAVDLFSSLDELSSPLLTEEPLTFEAIGQTQGYILYRTVVKDYVTDPALLSIPGLADRGYVFVDKVFVGILSRSENIYNVGIKIKQGQSLSIFVENQGRIAYGPYTNDFKGITSSVTLGAYTLSNWTMYSLPFNDSTLLDSVINNAKNSVRLSVPMDNGAFGIYYGEFVLNVTESSGTVLDTFLRLDGWNKGIAFINGFNLGRYWPVVGPQITLYLPAPYLNAPPELNKLIVFEQEGAPCKMESTCYVKLVDTPQINGTTPNTTE